MFRRKLNCAPHQWWQFPAFVRPTFLYNLYLLLTGVACPHGLLELEMYRCVDRMPAFLHHLQLAPVAAQEMAHQNLASILEIQNLWMKKMTEKCIVVPKTLRIDDPSAASKSQWATFGLPPNQKDPTSKVTIFKNLETRAEGRGRGHVSDAINVLEVNPAALSRSHTFQESG
ncbi:hypothetical protein OIU78_022483 [Salix suchowensis]|nr:hypothetical protein OIU78_022483 [Salix suchowensis]